MNENNIEPKDCLGCRLVGGLGCSGISIYVGFMAARNPHPIGKTVTFLFAGGFGAVGVARLFNLPPFMKTHKGI